MKFFALLRATSAKATWRSMRVGFAPMVTWAVKVDRQGRAFVA